MFKITYTGPGNNWSVTVRNGAKQVFSGATFRQAWSFVKAHGLA